jgi:acyl-coenzyme A thioesterase PaaI-like protein
MALANFCELTSGLAVLSALPQGTRGILLGFSITYLKKARGLLLAEARVDPATLPKSGDFIVAVEARDSVGDVVVRAEASWRLGMTKSS